MTVDGPPASSEVTPSRNRRPGAIAVAAKLTPRRLLSWAFAESTTWSGRSS